MLTNLSVLVVDDDPATVQLLSRIVTTVGLTAYRATSVDEALGLIRNYKPDIALFDYGFQSDVGGDILVDAWMNIDGGPLCVISGRLGRDLEIALLMRGVWNTVQKPVDVAMMQAILLRYKRYVFLKSEAAKLTVALQEVRRQSSVIQKKLDKAKIWRFIVTGLLAALTVLLGFDSEIVKMVLGFL